MAPFSPMDEIPFLDTDVARGTFLLTREDFLFFLDEYSIPPPAELQRDTVYVVTQFVEIGGDHLDSLMQYKQLKDSQQNISLAPSLVDILRRSHDLLLQSKKTIYFLNASTLFSILPTQELLLKSDAFESLVRRLRFLNNIFGDKHQMLFYLSRTSKSISFSPTTEAYSLKIAMDTLNISIPSQPKLPLAASPAESVCSFLQHVLQQVSEQERWANLQIVGVMPASHINENDGSLNADEVVNTLVRCFRTKMVDSHKTPDLAVVNQIWKCYKEEALEEFLELSHQSTEDLHFYADAEIDIDFYPIFWISKIVFRDYLLEEDEVEVPHPILIQRYGDVTKLMAGKGVLVQYHDHNHSDISIQISTNDGTKYTWIPPPDVSEPTPKPTVTGPNPEAKLWSLFPEKGPEPVVRCPHYAPLFKFMESNFITNPPSNFWSQDSSLDPQHYQHAAQQLEILRPKLEAEILDRWEKIQKSQDPKEMGPYVDTLFWLLEDWVMSVRILQAKHEKTLQFPLAFTVPATTLARMTSAGFLLHSIKDSATVVVIHAKE